MKYYQPIKKAFSKHFKGMDDPEFIKSERDYKIRISEKAWEILGQERFNELIEQENYQAIISNLKYLCEQTNLINWRDYDFLKKITGERAENFSKNMFTLLFNGDKPLEDRIDEVASILREQEGMNHSNTWNFVTYLLFIVHPQKHYHVKPSFWSEICKILGINNPKTVTLSGSSYKKIIELCQDIFNELAGSDLEPRDMIDLHSLLYILTGAYDQVEKYWVFKITDLSLWSLCRENRVLAMQYQYGKESAPAVTRNQEKAEGILPGHYIVAALKGKDKFLGFGVVSEGLFEESDFEKLYKGAYGQRVSIDDWEVALDAPLVLEGFEGNYALGKNPFDTVFEVSKEGFDLIQERLRKRAMEKIEYKLDDIFRKGFSRNIILEGPPGTGKTYTALKVLELGLGRNWQQLQFHALNDYSKGAWEIVQFHPNYSFEDFVRGLVAEPVEQGIVFNARDKVFAKMCKAAKLNADASFYLVIDEINRGDLSKILGELIYGLEYRGKSISLLYEIQSENNEIPTSLVVPENLFILGTMNTADRSIALVDYAIRRRFAFFKLSPDRGVIEEFSGFGEKAVRDEALRLFDSVQALFHEDTVDYGIGHTYFLVGDAEHPGSLDELRFKYRYQVIPLLDEYVKEGILQPENIRGLIEHE